MKLLTVSLICGLALLAVGQWMSRRPWGHDVALRFQRLGVVVAVTGAALWRSGWVMT